MAEWSNAAVLKTVEGHTSGGSNPSFSAKTLENYYVFKGFVFLKYNLFDDSNRYKIICFSHLLKTINL